MVNCPFWQDYTRESEYKDYSTLSKFAQQLFEMHVEMAEEDLDVSLREVQAELASALNITLADNTAEKVLPKFYSSATREPKFISTIKMMMVVEVAAAGHYFSHTT